MTRWKGEVDEDVSALESSIQKMDNKVAGMYSEPSLNTLEYRLHAVMVHEGSVNSGHYWAYVFDHARGVWLKFNDNTVNEATWDELQRESVGGHSNASAYSLVYLAASKSELLLETGEQQGSAGESSVKVECYKYRIRTTVRSTGVCRQSKFMTPMPLACRRFQRDHGARQH